MRYLILMLSLVSVGAFAQEGSWGMLERGCLCECSGHDVFEKASPLLKEAECTYLDGKTCFDDGAKDTLKNCKVAVKTLTK